MQRGISKQMSVADRCSVLALSGDKSFFFFFSAAEVAAGGYKEVT